jgi:hypothetical protein
VPWLLLPRQEYWFCPLFQHGALRRYAQKAGIRGLILAPIVSRHLFGKRFKSFFKKFGLLKEPLL